MAYFPNASQNSDQNNGHNVIEPVQETNLDVSKQLPNETTNIDYNIHNRTMSKTISKDELADVEAEILKLVGIQAVRIIVDQYNFPIEIHVVASSEKTPKQVAKDVQSILLANFYISIDYRIISVVQIQTNNEVENFESPSVSTERPIIERVTVEKNSNTSLARVTLRQGEYISEGFARGSAATGTRNRLVAQATLDSLKQINDIESNLEVISAEVISSQEYQIAVVVIMLINGQSEESLAGSALVNEEDISTAIAKAVLSATNRRLALQNI